MTAEPQTPSLARRTLAGAGWIMAWRMAARLLGFVNTLVLARILVPADFGLVAIATAFAGVFESLSQFSVQDALIRRRGDDTRLHDCAFTIQIGRALVTAVVMALFAPLAVKWFAEPRLMPVVLVLAAATVLNGAENIGTVEFTRNMRFDMFFRILVVPRFLQVAVTVLVAWYTHSYWALLVGIIVQRGTRVALTYVAHPYRPRLSLHGWRELAGFSFWLWAAGMASMVWDRSDTLIVGHYFGPVLLGLYTVGIQIAILPIMEIIAPLASVLLAGFSISQRTGGSATDNALPLAAVLLLPMVPMALLLSSGAAYVLPLLLGGQWVKAGPLVAIAAAICTIAPIVYVASAVLTTIGQVRRQFYAVSAAAVFRVVVLVVAARTADLRWVVTALLLSNAVEAILYIHQMRLSGHARLRRSAPGLIRIGLAGLGALLILSQVPGAWGHHGIDFRTHLSYVGDILELSVLAASAFASFVSMLAVLWFVCGRPEGPESMALRLGREILLGSTRVPRAVQ